MSHLRGIINTFRHTVIFNQALIWYILLALINPGLKVAMPCTEAQRTAKWWADGGRYMIAIIAHRYEVAPFIVYPKF